MDYLPDRARVSVRRMGEEMRRCRVRLSGKTCKKTGEDAGDQTAMRGKTAEETGWSAAENRKKRKKNGEKKFNR